MKVLDRYVGRALLKPLAGSMVAFLVVSIIVDLFERLDTFIDNDVPGSVIAHYYVATIPFLFVLILPVATLIGVLFGLGGLARHNELIATTATGISLYRVLRPALALGLMMSLLCLLMTVELVPRGNRVSNEIYNHEIKGRPRISGMTRRDVNYLGNGGRFFLIRSLDGDRRRLDGVVVQQFADGTLTKRIDAEVAEHDDGSWVFRKGYVRRFDDAGLRDIEPFNERRFPEITETPEDFLRTVTNPDEMTYSELRDHTRRTELSGGDTTKLKVAEQMRFSFPVASFLVVLLGAPLTSAVRRGGHALGFGLALLVGFAYYVLLQVGRTLGHSESLPPEVAAWLPNFAFLVFGIIGLWKTRK